MFHCWQTIRDDSSEKVYKLFVIILFFDEDILELFSNEKYTTITANKRLFPLLVKKVFFRNVAGFMKCFKDPCLILAQTC